MQQGRVKVASGQPRHLTAMVRGEAGVGAGTGMASGSARDSQSAASKLAGSSPSILGLKRVPSGSGSFIQPDWMGMAIKIAENIEDDLHRFEAKKKGNVGAKGGGPSKGASAGAAGRPPRAEVGMEEVGELLVDEICKLGASGNPASAKRLADRMRKAAVTLEYMSASTAPRLAASRGCSSTPSASPKSTASVLLSPCIKALGMADAGIVLSHEEGTKANDAEAAGAVFVLQVESTGSAMKHNMSGVGPKISKGDWLVSVDGVSVEGLKLDEVQRLVSGRPRTFTALEFERRDGGGSYMVSLERTMPGDRRLDDWASPTSNPCSPAHAPAPALATSGGGGGGGGGDVVVGDRALTLSSFEADTRVSVLRGEVDARDRELKQIRAQLAMYKSSHEAMIEKLTMERDTACRNFDALQQHLAVLRRMVGEEMMDDEMEWKAVDSRAGGGGSKSGAAKSDRIESNLVALVTNLAGVKCKGQADAAEPPSHSHSPGSSRLSIMEEGSEAKALEVPATTKGVGRVSGWMEGGGDDAQTGPSDAVKLLGKGVEGEEEVVVEEEEDGGRVRESEKPLPAHNQKRRGSGSSTGSMGWVPAMGDLVEGKEGDGEERDSSSSSSGMMMMMMMMMKPAMPPVRGSQPHQGRGWRGDVDCISSWVPPVVVGGEGVGVVEGGRAVDVERCLCWLLEDGMSDEAKGEGMRGGDAMMLWLLGEDVMADEKRRGAAAAAAALAAVVSSAAKKKEAEIWETEHGFGAIVWLPGAEEGYLQGGSGGGGGGGGGGTSRVAALDDAELHAAMLAAMCWMGQEIITPDLTTSWLPPVGEGCNESSSSSQGLPAVCDTTRAVSWLGGGHGSEATEQLRVQQWLPLSAGNRKDFAGAAFGDVGTARSIRWMSCAGSEPAASLSGDGATSDAKGHRASTAEKNAGSSSGGGVTGGVDGRAGRSADEGMGPGAWGRAGYDVGDDGDGGDRRKGSIVSAASGWLPEAHGLAAISAAGGSDPESLGWLDLVGDSCRVREAGLDDIDAIRRAERADVDVDDSFGGVGVDDGVSFRKRKLFGFGNAADASLDSLLPDEEIPSAADVVGGDDEGDTNLGANVGGLSSVVEDAVGSATEGITLALNPLLGLLNPWHVREAEKDKEKDEEEEERRRVRDVEGERVVDIPKTGAKRKGSVRLVSF